ncbi:signal peptidase I [Streptococcus ovis]|uniref:signal peptidase I n=1 Tax=Streptococcus ovis TaxID=82806 RepID=UPI00036675A5|nr:signal peptidase I [Streptococcus ovis]
MVKRDLFQHIALILVLIIGILALRVWVFEPVRINEQMANHYLAKEEVILAKRNSEIQYGDFVLYTVKNKKYVGRVIAMAGDSVTYMDDVLYRNQEIVHEAYLTREGMGEYYTQDMTIASLTDDAHVVVPKGSYLILNDKRTDTRDSREFGLIADQQIVGRLTFRISPLGKFGFIETGLAQ